MRFWSCGIVSIMLSSIAFSTSSRRRTVPCRASPMESSRETAVSSLLLISRALSNSPFSRAGSTRAQALRFLAPAS